MSFALFLKRLGKAEQDPNREVMLPIMRVTIDVLPWFP